MDVLCLRIKILHSFTIRLILYHKKKQDFLDGLKITSDKFLWRGLGEGLKTPKITRPIQNIFPLMLLFVTDHNWSMFIPILNNLMYKINNDNIGESEIHKKYNIHMFSMGRKIYEMILIFILDPITHLKVEHSLPCCVSLNG